MYDNTGNALTKLVPYWGGGHDTGALDPEVTRFLSSAAVGVLEHPQAIGNHFDYRKAIPMVGLKIDEVYPGGKTALPDDYTDLSYMVSQFGPSAAAVAAMREGTVAENVGFYPPDLLQALREKAATKKFGRPRQPGEWDVIGTEGAQGAIGYAFITFLNPGDEIIITDPAYMHFASCAVAVGAIPVPVALTAENRFRLTAEAVERAITPRSKMLVVCDPINPFGTVQSRDSLIEIADLCREHGIVVFNNTTHSGHQIDPEVQQVPMASLAETDVSHVVSASGLSKSHGLAAIRVGFLAGSTPFVKAVASMRMELTKIHINYIGQLGALAAIEDHDYVTESTEWIRGNSALLAEIVAATDGVRQPIAPEYGFSTMLDLSEAGATAQEVCVALFKRKFATIPGDALGDVGAADYLRVNFSHRERDRLERFGEALADSIVEARAGTHAEAVAEFYRREGTARGERIIARIEG